jgi:hypothetical protein
MRIEETGFWILERTGSWISDLLLNLLLLLHHTNTNLVLIYFLVTTTLIFQALTPKTHCNLDGEAVDETITTRPEQAECPDDPIGLMRFARSPVASRAIRNNTVINSLIPINQLLSRLT